VYPDQRFADLHELGRALAGLSGRRGPWAWGFGREPGAARAPSAPRRPERGRAPLTGSTLAGRAWRRAAVAAVIGCSIAAPLWAWRSARQQGATVPAAIPSPRAPADGHAIVPPPAASGAAPRGSSTSAPPARPGGAAALAVAEDVAAPEA